MTFLKIIIYVVVLLLAVMFFTLYKNDANLFEEPGFSKRMQVFLSTNVATTADEHDFRELRTPVFNIAADKLYQRVLYAASESGWEIAAHDSDNQNANFVVRSRLFLLEDDVYVQVRFIDTSHSSLYIQSSSRVGNVDFAANSGHIQTLVNALRAM